MEETTNMLADEKNKISEPLAQPKTRDAFDPYTSGLSSQMKHDTVEQLQKQLSILQTELDRVLYLLKVADPTGEAAKKRKSTAQQSKSTEFQHTQSVSTRADKSLPQAKKISKPEKLPSDSAKKQVVADVTEGSAKGQDFEQ